jgi:RNA polymerase primary sigma factor
MHDNHYVSNESALEEAAPFSSSRAAPASGLQPARPVTRRSRPSGSGSPSAGPRRSALPGRASPDRASQDRVSDRSGTGIERDADPLPRLGRRDESQLLEVIADVRQELLVLALESSAASRELQAMRREIAGGLRADTDWVETREDAAVPSIGFEAWCERVARIEAAIEGTLAERSPGGVRLSELEAAEWPAAVQSEITRQREALVEHVRSQPLKESALTRLLTAARPVLEGSRPRTRRPPRDLARRWDTAERRLRSAEARFVQANQGLVALVVKRYLGVGLSYPDLMQEGNIGLLRAVEKFDCRRGCRFSTYATWWIRQAVRRALANQARTIRLPVHTADARYALRQASGRLETRLGRQASSRELAEHTGLAPNIVSKLMNLVSEPVSLEAPRGDGGDTCLYDSLSDTESLNPAEGAHDRQMKGHLEGLIAALSPREAKMVRLRFGLDGRHERTLDEVGLEFGLTRERVRQVLEKALGKLRAAVPEDWRAAGQA